MAAIGLGVTGRPKTQRRNQADGCDDSDCNLSVFPVHKNPFGKLHRHLVTENNK